MTLSQGIIKNDWDSDKVLAINRKVNSSNHTK